MNISKYLTFVKTVELRSITKAAAELGYTQSGVSHIISDLEGEFGFPLLLRSHVGVSLTSDGERILPAIRGILNCNEQLSQIVASINGLDTGTIRIGAFTSVAVHWLPRMIKEFQRSFPHVDFKLLNGDYHDITLWLTEGSVDLGFVALPISLDCECIPLREDRLLAVLPLDHRLSGLSQFPLEEIANEPYISLLESSDQDACRAIESIGAHRNIKFATKDDYAIIAMVENGLGISIMPELLIQGHMNKVKVMELSHPTTRTIGIAIPPVSKSSPATRKFVDFVCKWVKEN